MSYHPAKIHVHKGFFDCIIILGAGQNKDGSPDKESLSRFSKALELYKNGFANKILLCGGKISTNTSLSKALRDVAIAVGVKTKNVLIEENSLDTLGNAVFSKQIVQKQHWKNLLLITSDYHLERALYLFHHVYGRKYTIAGIDTPTGILNRALRQRKEQRYLLALEAFLAETKPGNHIKILKKMKTHHPSYMQDGPKRSLLQKFLEKLRQ